MLNESKQHPFFKETKTIQVRDAQKLLTRDVNAYGAYDEVSKVIIKQTKG